MKTFLCLDCKSKVSKEGLRCKSCSNKNRAGKYKISEIGRKNISIFKIGKLAWNKGLNSKIDGRIKIKSLDEITAKKYGLRQQEWIDFSKNYRSNFKECYECQKPISLSNSDIDHRIPFKISKDSSYENLVVLCKRCHSIKTYHKDKVALWVVNH